MTYDGHEQYWYYWKGFQLGKSNHVAKTGREGEFQGGKNDIVNFQFQKPLGSFTGENGIQTFSQVKTAEWEN